MLRILKKKKIDAAAAMLPIVCLFSATASWSIDINPLTGEFNVLVDSSTWLKSAGIMMYHDLTMLSTQDNSLVHALTHSKTGTDALGAFEQTSIGWKRPDPHPAAVIIRTEFRVYAKERAVVFTQSFPSGVALFSNGSAGGEGVPGPRQQWGSPHSSFPSFDTSGVGSRLGGPSSLAFITYGEIGRPKPPVRFPGSGCARFKGCPSEGYEDGVPLTLFDETTGRAVVLSPLDSFYDLVCGLDPAASSSSPPPLRCGVIGTATSIPIAFSASMVLYVGETPSSTTGSKGRVSGAMLAWGALLLRWSGKMRGDSSSATQSQLTHLSYSSVGHYFYGLNLGRTFAETLLDVQAGAKANGLPFAFRTYLIDSFWYGETATAAPNNTVVPGFTGTWRWDDIVARRPHMIPDGLAALSKSLGGAEFVMHMGEWVGSDPTKFASSGGHGPAYASENLQWNWTVEPAASLPQGEGGDAFWDSLFHNMSAVGLRTFKLDHTQQQAPDMRATTNHVGATRGWLRGMALAAAKHGISKQYGGHIASAFLQATTLPNANVARVSDDYIPDVRRSKTFTPCANAHDATVVTHQGNVLMGRDSVLPWALGIYPYKDAFFSSANQTWTKTTCLATGNATVASTQHGTKPEWWGLQEPFPKLQALVSALSAGPVASGDGAGDLDVPLLMRTCREDGMLLKPERPAFLIDSWWTQAAFGHGGVKGEVTHTFTSLNVTQHGPSLRNDDDGVVNVTMLWRFVLSTALTESYSLDFNEVAQLTDLSRIMSRGTRRSTSSLSAGGDVAWFERYDAAMPPTLKNVAITPFDATHPLKLPAQTSANAWGEYTYVRTAPWLCPDSRRLALLGELGKFVSTSQQRVTSVDVLCGTSQLWVITVDLIGDPGEVVVLWFLKSLDYPDERVPVSRNATIGEDGTASIIIQM